MGDNQQLGAAEDEFFDVKLRTKEWRPVPPQTARRKKKEMKKRESDTEIVEKDGLFLICPGGINDEAVGNNCRCHGDLSPSWENVTY